MTFLIILTCGTPAHLISSRAGAAGAMFICSEQQNDEVIRFQLP